MINPYLLLIILKFHSKFKNIFRLLIVLLILNILGKFCTKKQITSNLMKFLQLNYNKFPSCSLLFLFFVSIICDFLSLIRIVFNSDKYLSSISTIFNLQRFLEKLHMYLAFRITQVLKCQLVFFPKSNNNFKSNYLLSRIL